MLSRYKTPFRIREPCYRGAQAEQLERNIFGPKQVGVVTTAEQGGNRVIISREAEFEVEQGNETLN